MDMLALFFPRGNDMVVTARYAEISSGAGMTARFYTKPDKTTPDNDPAVTVYQSTVVADPDNIGSTLSQFNIPSTDTQDTGAFWWRVDVTDALNKRRTANQGPLLIEAV
jgi:hypothetical protein